MKVYIGYECHYNGIDIFKTAVKVFQFENTAMLWVAETKGTEYNWCEYEQMDVEQ